MSTPSDSSASDEAKLPEEIGRAARLRAMGSVLRDVTSDETDDGWGQSPGPADAGASDAALRREVPPHHGG